MKKNRWFIGLVAAAWVALLVLNLYAAEGIRKVPVHFKKGTSQATIQGHIKGRETIDYVLRAREGQTMTVNLKTSHTGLISTYCRRVVVTKPSSSGRWRDRTSRAN